MSLFLSLPIWVVFAGVPLALFVLNLLPSFRWRGWVELWIMLLGPLYMVFFRIFMKLSLTPPMVVQRHPGRFGVLCFIGIAGFLLLRFVPTRSRFVTWVTKGMVGVGMAMAVGGSIYLLRALSGLDELGKMLMFPVSYMVCAVRVQTNARAASE